MSIYHHLMTGRPWSQKKPASDMKRGNAMKQSSQDGTGGVYRTVRHRIFGRIALAATLGVAGAALNGCGQSDDDSQSKDATRSAVITGVSESAQKIATERGLTPDDVKAALATYLPSGKHDDYVMFAS